MQLRFVLLRQLHPFFLIKRLVRCLYNEIVRQSEVHNRFGWYVDIPVTGQSRDCGSGAATRQTTNCDPYAT